MARHESGQAGEGAGIYDSEMNCKHCGSKLGMLERWRYGDFCSQGHKDDFAEDLVRLNEQIVKDLRRIPNRLKGQAEEPEEEVASPPTAEEVAAPPEAGFVLAPEPAPLLSKPETVAAEVVPVQRGKGDQWRLFAKVADWSELPVSVLAASQKRQQRFVWVVFAEESVVAGHGNLLSGEYPATLPHPELRQWQARLQMAVQSEPSAIVTPATPQTVEQEYWVDDQGWRWIPEGAPVTVPDFGPVLSEYPIAAPWLNWTAGAGFTPRPTRSQPGQPGQPGQPAQPGQPGQPGQPVQPVQAGQTAQGFPQSAAPPVMAPPMGQPATQMPTQGMAPGYPSEMPQGVMPGYPARAPQTMAPGYPSTTLPAGVPGPAAWPGGPAWAGGMVGYAPHASAIPPVPPWSMGLVWQELPPPLFNALVDPSHCVRPMHGLTPHREPPVDSIAYPAPPLPECPAGPEVAPAILLRIDRQADPAASIRPAGSQPIRTDWQPRTLWRRMLTIPAHIARLSKPGIPMRPAPPLRLKARPVPPAPMAAPVMYTGRWID